MDGLYPVILQIVNLSIATCSFPDPLKHASVTPIIKDFSKDHDDFKNYRPVSSLPYISKVLEKIMYSQLSDYIEGNNLHARCQSSYRKHHSCETAIAKLVYDLQVCTSNGDHVFLVLLDSSAAFDTVDHNRLLDKLEKQFLIKGDALTFIKSYLINRSFSTTVNNLSSTPKKLLHGVPQGSLLTGTVVLYPLYKGNRKYCFTAWPQNPSIR